MGLYNCTMYSIIKHNAIAYKDRIAWKFGDQVITHGQFHENINRLARGLVDAGLQKGDRIGILAQNSLDYIYLYGASAQIGSIVVPISWRLKPKEVEYIISDAHPKILFIESEFQEMIRKMTARFWFIERYFILDKPMEGFAFFKDLFIDKVGEIQSDVGSNDTFVILYTAALSGEPKGAMLSHQNLIYYNLQTMCVWRLTHEDVNINLLPFFHTQGLVVCLSVMQAGGLNIIIPKFDADLTLKHIQEDRVTVFSEFAPMLTTILDKAREGNFDLSSLRIITGLDSYDTIKRLEELASATFWTGYGQTETSGGSVSLAPYLKKPGSAGVCTLLSEVKIVDHSGKTVETGEVGEIVVRGPMVFKGYWNREKETENIFRGGWHHTGDTGHLDADGYLWFRGPLTEKELIKTGGENVYPEEVEKAILQHPLIEETVVFGVPDSQWGEAVKAICVLKKGQSMDEEELMNFVANRIARFKKPKYVSFVSSLPKNIGGDLNRERVKALYREDMGIKKEKQ